VYLDFPNERGISYSANYSAVLSNHSAASSNYFPPMSDCSPSMSDYSPSMSNCFPPMSDHSPPMSDCSPSLSDCFPSVSDCFPAVPDCFPSVSIHNLESHILLNKTSEPFLIRRFYKNVFAFDVLCLHLLANNFYLLEKHHTLHKRASVKLQSCKIHTRCQSVARKLLCNELT
jgi:hypothetical protein